MATATIARDVLTLLARHYLAVLVALFLTRAVYRRYVHPLRSVPGPFLASVTNLWLVSMSRSKTQHWDTVELHRRYGPVVRISPNRVLVCSPNAINEFWTWNKGPWWSAFWGHPTVIDHGALLDAKEAGAAKANITPGYSMTNIIKSESKVDTHVQDLMAQFTKRTNHPFDIAPWTQFFTLDVVLDIAFSQPLGFITSGRDLDNVISAIHAMFDVASIFGLYPWLPRLLNHPLWYPRFSPTASDTRGIPGLYGLAYRTARARLQDDEATQAQHDDILQRIIDHRSNASSTLIEQEAKAPIFAGSDTTAGNLRAMILHVFTNPRVHGKLLAQITAAESQGLLSSPIARYEEIVAHVPYLLSVRKEALRMVPVAATPFYREVPWGGVRVEGFNLPAGTEVGLAHWAVSRSEAFFGGGKVGVDVFWPERWEDDEKGTDEEKERRRLRDLGDVFFGKGGRMCTGRHVASLEVLKMFVELVRRFEVQVVRPERPWTEKGSLAVLHWDFEVVLRERER